MPDRFYVPGEWSQFLDLDGTEAHHLVRVLRAVPGDVIQVFDGHGKSAAATVTEVQKRTVRLQVSLPGQLSLQPSPEVVLAAAVPKGDRLAWMIEKVTELGVDRFIPLSTERSVVKPSDQKLHKAEQTVIAACKQSGRDHLMTIEPVCSLLQLMTRPDLQAARYLVGARQAENYATILKKESCDYPHLVVIIGPEGGLTLEEQSFLQQAGVQLVSLSPQILRIETAAVAFAAWLCGLRTGSAGGKC